MKQSTHELGQIARNKVTNKLEERNYKVAMGNKRMLSIESPTGKKFNLKVTSLSRHNAWIINDQGEADCFYVLVYQPREEPTSYFILKSDEVRKELENNIKSLRKPIDEYSNSDLERKGLNFKKPFKYENNWDSLPE